jgi:hypothetical protein
MAVTIPPVASSNATSESGTPTPTAGVGGGVAGTTRIVTTNASAAAHPVPLHGAVATMVLVPGRMARKVAT